ncbi:hypothetical protein [Mesorhizobium sp. M0898]|uniref:hypothetical protein n=1 Tax=Mesorhizobium sp. M0898 TaxID=2957020 RepID=UPI00333DDB81
MEAFIFSLVDPARSSCPGWIIHGGQPIPLKMIFALTLFPAFWACFVFLRWKHFSKTMHAAATGNYVPPLSKLLGHPKIDPFTFPHDQVFRTVIVLWCIFCTSPLWLMLTFCTNTFGYLGFNR